MDPKIMTESELAEIEGKKTYTITLTKDQRTLLTYTGIGIIGFFIAKYMIKSAVKSIRED